MQTAACPRDRSRPHHDSASWTLVREGRTLSCALFRLEDQRYLFQIVPVWHADLAIVETFGGLHDAARRSVEVTQQLRSCGWLLTSRVGLPPVV